MKHHKLLRKLAVPVSLVLAASAAAQMVVPLILEKPPVESPNHFGASFRMAFNVDVSFNDFGSFSSLGGLRLTPGGDPFNYDDGYVLVDSTGNAMGYTRYWGYDSADQVPGDGTLLMHRTSSAGTSAGGNDDPLPGFELTYSRELGRGEKWRWGVEAAFGYMKVSVRDSGSSSISVTRMSVPFQLPTIEGGGFVALPQAPYYHGPDLSPEGNPVITAVPLPSSSTVMSAGMTGSRKFDADIFTLRLGPYLELPLSENWAFGFSGGLALAEVSSDFSFNESIQLAGLPATSGSGSQSGLQVGGYVAANVSCKLNEDWALFGGVQFQSVGEYSQRENGREAVLDMSQSMFVTIGASFSF